MIANGIWHPKKDCYKELMGRFGKMQPPKAAELSRNSLASTSKAIDKALFALHRFKN